MNTFTGIDPPDVNHERASRDRAPRHFCGVDYIPGKIQPRMRWHGIVGTLTLIFVWSVVWLLTRP